MSRPPRPRGAVPWGLVGMLALVALGEWAFARFEMDVLLPEHWDWRNAGKFARSEARGAGVLCFGDSLMKSSVLPTLVEAGTGRAAYNLAVPMGSTPSSYFLFRGALRAGARPTAVLLDATPFLLRTPPDAPVMMRHWPDLLRPDELFDLAWSARAAAIFTRAAVDELLPTLRARQEVRAGVRAFLTGEPRPQRFQAARFLRNARVNRGANALEASPFGATEISAASRWLFEGFRADPVNVAYLDRFLDLAASRGVAVFLVITPASTGAQRYAEANGFDAAHTAFVQSLRERHPGLTVADGRRSGYGPSLHFMDPLHLNHLGAAVFSDDLATVLARALDGGVPRWLELPRYRVRPARIDIEDVGESGMALIENGRKMRR